jgi:hypothetical protein
VGVHDLSEDYLEISLTQFSICTGVEEHLQRELQDAVRAGAERADQGSRHGWRAGADADAAPDYGGRGAAGHCDYDGEDGGDGQGWAVSVAI